MKILYLPHMLSQQRQHEKLRWIYPILLAMQAQYYRNLGYEVWWDKWPRGEKPDLIINEPENIPFLSLPCPDRIFTDAFNPKYQRNGNYKYLPGTYIQSANGCWHGKCAFCVEQNNKWEARPVDDVISEIVQCKLLNVKEIFDDSGTFPVGEWLSKFCAKLAPISDGLRFSCNMRMVDLDYSLLHRCGFRMVLFGLESANQKTLDKINKGVIVEDVRYVIRAAEAGLEPHIAVMFGYPWETDEDAQNTLRLVWMLLRKGYAKTAQASLYTVPGETPNESQHKYVRQIYRAAYSAEFWFNKLKDIKTKEDFQYIARHFIDGLRSATR